MDYRAIAFTLLLSSVPMSAGLTAPIPDNFESSSQDNKAIDELLQTYTNSVSKKDQAAFERLLLDKSIPFERVAGVSEPKEIEEHIKNYDDFRKLVFEGKPSVQRFERIRVLQDGKLADVTLVFGGGRGLRMGLEDVASPKGLVRLENRQRVLHASSQMNAAGRPARRPGGAPNVRSRKLLKLDSIARSSRER